MFFSLLLYNKRQIKLGCEPMEFTKVHGLGNDFILLEPEAYGQQDVAALAVKLCDRHTGVGADGLLLTASPTTGAADIRMRIINQDGSEAEMCGNGIRCFARYVYERGLVLQPTFRIETKGGIMTPYLTLENGRVTAVRVDMGPVIFDRARIPALGSGRCVLAEPLQLEDGSRWTVTSVLMGVPHTVIFLDSLSDELVQNIGPKVEKNAMFPQGTNVNFVVVHHRGDIEVRTWERGAGATLACGTGCCAAVVAACQNGYTDRNVTVHLRLGDLQVAYREDGHVWMTGPAELVYHGVWETDSIH